MKKITIACLIVLFLSSHLSAENSIKQSLVGKWQYQESVQNVLVTTMLTFQPDNKFKYAIEESMDKSKRSTYSEGKYSLNNFELTMEYESFEGIPLPAKDKKTETFNFYIIDNMLGFPAYSINKNSNSANKIYSTYFTSFEINNKFAFEAKELNEETISLKSDSTAVIANAITKNQKALGKNKERKVSIEKSGKYKKEKDGSIIITLTTSTVDRTTTEKNPEIKKIKIFEGKEFTLMNPFSRVKE